MEKVVIKNNEKGRGVYSTQTFHAGEIVIIGKIVEECAERTCLTLQMDVDKHVRMDIPFELVNHSCNPNTGIKSNEFGGYSLVAMRDIDEGEEITFDYSMTEWISIAVPECKCQSQNCRKTIGGGKYLSDSMKAKYSGYLAPYYKKMN